MNANNNNNQNERQAARSFEHTSEHNPNQPSRQQTNLTESSQLRENFMGGFIDSNQAQQSQMNQMAGVGGVRAVSNTTPLVSDSGFFNGGVDGISPAASSIRDTKSIQVDE